MDERVKLPKGVVYLIWAYMGVVGVMTLTGVDLESNKAFNIFWAISLSIYTAAATYGTISIFEDLKKQGLKYIAKKIGLVYLIRKIKRLFNK